MSSLEQVNPFTDFTKSLLDFKTIAKDSLKDTEDTEDTEKDNLRLFIFQRVVNSIDDIEAMLHMSENASLQDLRHYVKERKIEEDILLRFLILREVLSCES